MLAKTPSLKDNTSMENFSLKYALKALLLRGLEQVGLGFQHSIPPLAWALFLKKAASRSNLSKDLKIYKSTASLERLAFSIKKSICYNRQ